MHILLRKSHIQNESRFYFVKKSFPFKMTDSITDSGHDTSSTLDTSVTNNTGTSLTLGKIPYHKQLNDEQTEILPKLPSHKFRYSVWHDLRETCLTGDQLHAPRVRAGPPEKEKQFHEIIEEGLPIHHELSGKKRQNYMNQYENWEEAKVINLCYQNLMDEYQWVNFFRILKRCQKANIVNLSYNKIETLSGIDFLNCDYLNVNNNFLTSMTHFPKMPKVKKITAMNNAIGTLSGLDRYRFLEELYLSGNPVCFTMGYRHKVFATLPQLRILDGVPRLPSDEQDESAGERDASNCVIL